MKIKVAEIKSKEVTKSRKKEQKKPKYSRAFVEERIYVLKQFTEEQKKSYHLYYQELTEWETLLDKMRKGKYHREKGSSYERKIAEKFLEAYGITTRRTPQSGGFAKKCDKAEEFRGDIVAVDKDVVLKLLVECKDQKTWRLAEWLEQATGDCPDSKYPVVIFHKEGINKHKPSEDFVAMPLDVFFAIVPKENIVGVTSNMNNKRSVETKVLNESMKKSCANLHIGKYDKKDVKDKVAVTMGKKIRKTKNNL